MKKSIALFGIALMGGSLLGCSSDEGASCTKLEIMAGAPGCSTPTGGGPGLGNDGGTAGPADPNMPVPGGNDIDPEDVDREDPPMPGGNNPPGGGGGNPPGGGGGNPPGGGMQCADPYGAWKDDPANTVSACANDMIPCLSACDINDSACIQGCTAAVPTCQACVLHNWQYCQGRECDTDYQAAMCCVDANSCTDDACIQANCGTEVTAFQNCVGSPATAAVCDDFNSAGYSECFDGGVAPPPPPPAMCVNTTYGTYVEDGGKAKDCAGELADCLATCDINDTTCIFDTCLGDASNECASCVQWNYQTCWPRTCKAEYEALECCEQAGGNCAAEDSAYETCYLSAATEVICDDFHGEVFEECFGAATPKACEAPPALYPDGYEYCTGTTKNCLAACPSGDYNCINGCIGADKAQPIRFPSGFLADCVGCLSYTQSACGAHSGCGTEWGDYSCCVADNGCTTADCRSANCGTEWTAYGTCSDEETSCFTNYSKGAYNVCFK